MMLLDFFVSPIIGRNIHSVGCLERKVAFAALTSTTIHDCATSIDTSNGLSILVLHVS
jgi:hypothetical protein